MLCLLSYNVPTSSAAPYLVWPQNAAESHTEPVTGRQQWKSLCHV